MKMKIDGVSICFLGLLVLIIILYHSTIIQAAPGFVSEVSNPSPWGKVELWESGIVQMQNGQEPILQLSLPANDKVNSWFPSDIFIMDGSSSSYEDYDCGDFGHLKTNKYFLLGYGSNWSSARKSTPVLLIHGAADDMNRAWAHPWEKNTPTSISQTGLLQYLDSRGYAVFAISFSHTQGNNLIQAQLIADAIEVILDKTGATQVDIVAHSKGNLAVIAYLSSLKNEWNDTLWMTDYRGDVRKYVAVAAPFKGLDTMFRYYTANTTTIADNLSSPTAFYNAYIYYAYRDYHRWDMTDTYSNNFFAGQTQLLHNWVDDPDYSIDFNAESATWGDFNATRNALYWGGSSFYISSEGIDAAINNAQGSMGTSNFIEKMNNRGINPYIDLFVLYGTNQVINYTWFGYSIGEKADTSDGLLFVASATYTAGVTKRGADLIWKSGMDYNHLDIVRENEPLEWIENALAY